MKEKGKKFVNEFKDFAMRGNVLDLAIGVIIGGAFNKIVSSLVKDVIMPPIGLLTGGVNFSDLAFVLDDGVTINYGLFIQNIVDFLIIALSVFILVKVVNKLNGKKEEEAKKEEEVKKQEENKLTVEQELLTEIRDLLKSNQDISKK